MDDFYHFFISFVIAVTSVNVTRLSSSSSPLNDSLLVDANYGESTLGSDAME
jgi:hypothetical protein